jgi:probable selenium-dependent hydroxylase accessory protein YqeC
MLSALIWIHLKIMNVFVEKRKNKMQLASALPLAKGMSLSFVGAGGKTSLIFSLAAELAAQGHSVLVTTTTAIFHPDHDSQPHDLVVLGEIKKCCRDLPKAGQIVVAAKNHDPKSNKLKGYSPGELAGVREGHFFDYILIEADGSRRLPIKAPAAHEPVIPGWTDMVVGCIGLDCLGRPMDGQTVHRPECLAAVTKQSPGDLLGPDHLVSLVAASRGLFKNTTKNMRKIVFFNKADTKGLVQKGRALASRVLKECPGVENCLVTCLLDTQNPLR